MSVNISSDGSPTPRKSLPRFSGADTLGLETSQEVMGQVVGIRRPYRSSNTSQLRALRPLTSNLQNYKRPDSVAQDKLQNPFHLQQQSQAPRISSRQASFKVINTRWQSIV